MRIATVVFAGLLEPQATTRTIAMMMVIDSPNVNSGYLLVGNRPTLRSQTTM
jgi:hypothetical protein